VQKEMTSATMSTYSGSFIFQRINDIVSKVTECIGSSLKKIISSILGCSVQNNHRS